MVNPILPALEYVPDPEPYVFGDRVYIYGSHDIFDAPLFCMGDYVGWSAPLDDLTNWRYEGVIYCKNQDPKNSLGLRLLFAPDVCQGLDGKYYMYYAFDYMSVMGVAVSSSPAGPFKFYGHVRYADGQLWGRREGDSFIFDPSVFIDDDGRVYLYSGFATPVPAAVTGGQRQQKGAYAVELEPDMLTIRGGEKLVLPFDAPGFEGHSFFEAASMRKIDGQYVFVYSSENNHELCWSTADSPWGPFTFRGTLIDQGDLYMRDPSGEKGNADELHASNYLGNTHGGLVQIGEDWYIFYHRQTHRNSYARQACAEKLTRTADGGFKQAEVTSQGLPGTPLEGKGAIEARIACNLWADDHETGRYDIPHAHRVYAQHPYFTQTSLNSGFVADAKKTFVSMLRSSSSEGAECDSCERCEDVQYIANMRRGATAGFKYFTCGNVRTISVSLAARVGQDTLVRGARSVAQSVREGNWQETLSQLGHSAQHIGHVLLGKKPQSRIDSYPHGRMLVRTSADDTVEPVCAIEVGVGSSKQVREIAGRKWHTFSGKLDEPLNGVVPLYFTYEGIGAVDFLEFILD